jgi:hypothetical protein
MPTLASAFALKHAQPTDSFAAPQLLRRPPAPHAGPPPAAPLSPSACEPPSLPAQPSRSTPARASLTRRAAPPSPPARASRQLYASLVGPRRLLVRHGVADLREGAATWGHVERRRSYEPGLKAVCAPEGTSLGAGRHPAAHATPLGLAHRLLGLHTCRRWSWTARAGRHTRGTGQPQQAASGVCYEVDCICQ